jgi:hypothetical protein
MQRYIDNVPYRQVAYTGELPTVRYKVDFR